MVFFKKHPMHNVPSRRDDSLGSKNTSSIFASRRDDSLGSKNTSSIFASRRDASIGHHSFTPPKEASLRDAGYVSMPFSTERNIPTGCSVWGVALR